MKKTIALALSLALSAVSYAAEIKAQEVATLKQPVFLLCPHKERYSALSLSMVVEKSDPSKPVKVVLEKLSGKNGKDDGYVKVLAAQQDPKSEREEVASLEVAAFPTGSLRVDKDNALNISVTPDGKTYKLMIDMRIAAEGRFMIGGSDASKRTVILKYSKFLKAWEAYATVLEDKDGRNIAEGDPILITGLAFPVTATGIYRIGAVLAGGTSVLVYDK